MVDNLFLAYRTEGRVHEGRKVVVRNHGAFHEVVYRSFLFLFFVLCLIYDCYTNRRNSSKPPFDH